VDPRLVVFNPPGCGGVIKEVSDSASGSGRMDKLRYLSGEEVLAGDRIVVVTKEETIWNVFLPGTDGSKHYNCWDTGGVLIKFDDGDLQLWPKTDGDLKFIKRKG
jgi:hypothetical protein